MKNDIQAIIGSPTSRRMIAGSRRYDCTMCSGECWLAPVGQKIVADGAKPVCLNCYMSRIRHTEHETAITPETAREVLNWLKRN